MATPLPRRALAHVRLADWPSLDDQVLTEQARVSFRQRRKALEAYVRGEPVDSIERSFGIVRATIRRLLARAASPPGRAAVGISCLGAPGATSIWRMRASGSLCVPFQ
jgi:hypothetical protein